MALIISALAGASLFFFTFIGLTNGVPYVSETLSTVSGVLLIFGLPGIQTIQPQTKYWEQIGLFLIVIPPIYKTITDLILLFAEQPLELNQLAASIWNPLASVGIVYLGCILVGWLTIQARIFPAWVGWLLLTVGICNDAIWLLISYVNLDSIPFSIIFGFSILVNLLELAAVAGLGYH